MFYSHEILTDRKHGVATIWLVATLGSRSSLKKITRKAIMDVDVPNACGTITDPTAPMALRLQGNLLYGVSRVFSQQCAYVLTDMQSLRDKMRGVAMLLKEFETDPSVVTTRPEQLNLQIDPAFNIDLDLGFDLSGFDTSSSTEPSSLLSPRTLPSSHSSFLDDEMFMDHALPLEVSSSHNAGGGIDFAFDEIEPETEDGDKQDVGLPAMEVDNEDLLGITEESRENRGSDMLGMSEDGTVILLGPPERAAVVSDPQLTHDDLGAEDMQDFSIGLVADMDEVEPITLPSHLPSAHDSDGMNLINDDHQSPQDPVSSLARSGGADIDIQPSIERVETTQDEEAEVVIGAAPQRAVKRKVVPFDDPAELPNRTLADWNDHYLDFMASADLEKAGKISAAQAKRNAAYWLLDQGLGDVGSNFREDYEEHPLAIFSGESLIRALTGLAGQAKGRKRSASVLAEDDNTDGSQGSRRVRSRSDGQAPTAQDDDDPVQVMSEGDLDNTFGGDEVEAEVGRELQAPLSDHPVDMPWNTYASSRPGSARPGISMAGVSSSAHGGGGFEFNLPSSNVKRVSQLMGESPLDRRGRLARSSVVGGSSERGDLDLGSVEGDFDMDDDELDAQLAGNLDENFELYGPAADVSTQEAATSQWVAETLEKEAFNFLEFLQTTIRQKESIDEETPTITFEELLPLDNNTEIVAAQGLLHVLSLATKGLINVRQDNAFGDIDLSVVDVVVADSTHAHDDGGDEAALP